MKCVTAVYNDKLNTCQILQKVNAWDSLKSTVQYIEIVHINRSELEIIEIQCREEYV